MTDAGLLAGRLLLVFIFLHEGWSIFGQLCRRGRLYAEVRRAVMLLPLVIALQLGGGALIAAGIMTRFAALAFAVFCALTAILFHWQFADRNQLLHFQKDLAIAGGFLVLACCGPGNWSIDRYLARSRN